MDINVSSQIVVQTAAQWAADNTVYSAKRILVTSDAYYGSTDQRKFKIADGTQTWANLDYMPISQTLAQVIANGDTLNGLLAQSNDTFSKLYVEDGDIDVYYNNGVKLARIVASALSLELTQTDLIKLSAPTINLPQATASRIVETDASKNLTYVAKGTAYNKNFGVSSGDILLLGSTSVASQILATDANNQVQTLATSTYPSLTELSYVKGLTSAVQTQLDNKRSTTTEMLLFVGSFPATNLAASTTYYWSNMNGLQATATQSFSKFTVANNFTVTKVVLVCSQNVNPSSGNTSLYIRESATTDKTITTTLDLSTVGTNTSKVFVYSGLNLSLTSGTDYEFKTVTPAMATTPTNCRWHIQLWGY